MYGYLSYEPLGKIGKQVGEIDDIIKWLDSYGLRAGVSRYSRYKEYIAAFQLQAESEEERKKILLPSDLEDRYVKSDSALKEIAQIKFVYMAFKNEKSEGFIERIRKVVSGKDFYTGEEGDQARDFLYELVVASWYKNAGYEIDFDYAKKTDVVAKGNNNLYIECKRLKSTNGFEKNYRKACKQLMQVQRGDNEISLVYVDVYNCISSIVPRYEYKNIAHIKDTVDRAMKSGFEKDNLTIINRLLNEYKENVDGIVFTTVGNYAINTPLKMEIELYIGQNVYLYKDISDDRFRLITNVLTNVGSKLY